MRRLMAPTRKPLFTRPAWAPKVASPLEDPNLVSGSFHLDKDDDRPVFGSKHLYEDIVAEERRRREKHAQRVKEREKKATGKNAITDSDKATHRSKRRRTSEVVDTQELDSELNSDNDVEDDSISATSPVASAIPTEVRASVTKGAVPATSPLRVFHKQRTNITAITSSGTEDSESMPNEDDHETREASLEILDTKQIHSASESEEEDDEFLRELKEKARAEARCKKLADQGVNTQDSALAAVSGRSGAHSQSAHISPMQDNDSRKQRAESTPVPDDPHVDICIKSIIPNTTEVIAKRRVSQPLDKLRDYFCQRNGLNPAIASKVFFTWRGARLYNSTTMRGVIETLKREKPMANGGDPSGGKILLEAVTDEIVEYYKEQQEKRQREAQQAADDDASHGMNKESGTEKTEKHAGTGSKDFAPKITLICPGIEDMNIRLRANTSVGKIIAAFRSVRQIDPQKQCWLSYDGDRLEPEQTAETIGFENEDTVDVYLR